MNFDVMLDSLLEGVQIIDFSWQYVYVNKTVVSYDLDAAKEDLLGHSMLEKYPGIEGTDVFAVLKRCMNERNPDQIEVEFTHADQRTKWFQLGVIPVQEGIMIVSLDISMKKEADEKNETFQ